MLFFLIQMSCSQNSYFTIEITFIFEKGNSKSDFIPLKKRVNQSSLMGK